MAQSELQELIQIRKDSEFLNKAYDNLKKEYTNQFIAIKDGKVIANHKDIHILLKIVEDKKIDPAMILIEFVSPIDMLLIL